MQGVRLVCLGAGQDVGRSCVVVTLEGVTVMFDCGMHMGYADAVLAKMLVKKGGQLLEPTAGFFVEESEGPLAGGELERAVEWAKSISAR